MLTVDFCIICNAVFLFFSTDLKEIYVSIHHMSNYFLGNNIYGTVL